MSHKFGIEDGWWRNTAACTKKTGWVTTIDDTDPKRLAQLQIAACTIGVQVVLMKDRLMPSQGVMGRNED